MFLDVGSFQYFEEFHFCDMRRQKESLKENHEVSKEKEQKLRVLPRMPLFGQVEQNNIDFFFFFKLKKYGIKSGSYAC